MYSLATPPSSVHPSLPPWPSANHQSTVSYTCWSFLKISYKRNCLCVWSFVVGFLQIALFSRFPILWHIPPLCSFLLQIRVHFMDRPYPSVDGHLGWFPFWLLQMLLCGGVNFSACTDFHFSWEYTQEWNCWCLFFLQKSFPLLPPPRLFWQTLGCKERS